MNSYRKVGEEKFDKLMKTYFNKYKFKIQL